MGKIFILLNNLTLFVSVYLSCCLCPSSKYWNAGIMLQWLWKLLRIQWMHKMSTTTFHPPGKKWHPSNRGVSCHLSCWILWHTKSGCEQVHTWVLLCKTLFFFSRIIVISLEELSKNWKSAPKLVFPANQSSTSGIKSVCLTEPAICFLLLCGWKTEFGGKKSKAKHW